jgi:hypothetical protein
MSVTHARIVSGQDRPETDTSTYRIGRSGTCGKFLSGTGHLRYAMRQPRHGRKPGKKSKTGLSPEVRETIIKALPGIIKAVAALIEALKTH